MPASHWTVDDVHRPSFIYNKVRHPRPRRNLFPSRRRVFTEQQSHFVVAEAAARSLIRCPSQVLHRRRYVSTTLLVLLARSFHFESWFSFLGLVFRRYSVSVSSPRAFSFRLAVRCSSFSGAFFFLVELHLLVMFLKFLVA